MSLASGKIITRNRQNKHVIAEKKKISFVITHCYDMECSNSPWNSVFTQLKNAILNISYCTFPGYSNFHIFGSQSIWKRPIMQSVP